MSQPRSKPGTAKKPNSGGDAEPQEPEAKPCFVIAPIGPAGSDIRRRSNQIMKYLIRPVLSEYNYKAVRGDEMDQAGLITSHILSRIANDPLVIADLTDANPNVYYELAVRHVLQKPFIQLLDSAQRLPFDVAGLRTILVDHRDLDSVEDAKLALARAIESVEKGDPIETPMSYAVELQSLRSSENPEEQGIAQILEALTRMRLEIRRTRPGSREKDEYLSRDFAAARSFINKIATEGRVSAEELRSMITLETSPGFDGWVERLMDRAQRPFEGDEATDA